MGKYHPVVVLEFRSRRESKVPYYISVRGRIKSYRQSTLFEK